MKKIESCLAKVFMLVTALMITACASEAVTWAMSGPPRVRTDIFPGNHWNYSMGQFQKLENFENIERAQWNSQTRSAARVWGDIKPSQAPIANLNILQGYFPFDVRWKLKDGREYIVENIDVRTISNNFLRSNPIQLQWQREGRPQAKVGDGGAVLSFEVKDDTVLLKWTIQINQTPVDQRLTAAGAATKWNFKYEEVLMGIVKGSPTSGIDFNKTYELRK